MSVPQSLIVRTLAFSLLAALSCARAADTACTLNARVCAETKNGTCIRYENTFTCVTKNPEGSRCTAAGQCDAQTLFAQDPRVHAGRQRHLP